MADSVPLTGALDLTSAHERRPLTLEILHAWVTTVDHKKIGLMYIGYALIFLVIAGLEAIVMRVQLAVPQNSLVSPQVFNRMFTMHGTTMVFFVGMPILFGFGNYLIPLMLGARDMAFPRLNAISYWLFLAGGIVFYASLFWSPPEAGWISTVPLATSTYLPSGGEDAWIYMIHFTSIASFLGGINFLVTIKNMRAPGMTWSRIPLFIWSIIAYSLLLVAALPILEAAVTMLFTDRNFGTHFFNSAEGGSVLMWQDLFWFFGHPEVYVLILPAFWIISETLPVFSRKPIFGYKAIAASTMMIAFLGFLVWVHHMFTTPTPLVVLIFAMISSFLIAVPTGIKIFNWIGTLWQGAIEFRTPLLFSVGLVALFIIGGISGVMLAMFPVDWQLNDTYFVVAHLHYVFVGGSVFGIFAGIYYWFPKITGRMLSEALGKWSFWLMFIGTNVTFLIQHSLGLDGMPRRVYEYPNVGHLQLYNQISTVGSFILAAGVAVTIFNVWRSLKVGAIAGPDPWKANTLEWFTSSPPPVNNFDVVPVVRSAEPMKDIRHEVQRRDAGATAGAATAPAGATQVGL